MEGCIMNIKEQLKKVRESIAEYPDVRIVVATKYITTEQTKEVIDAGLKDLGENRTDSFLEKYEAYKRNYQANNFWLSTYRRGGKRSYFPSYE